MPRSSPSASRVSVVVAGKGVGLGDPDVMDLKLKLLRARDPATRADLTVRAARKLRAFGAFAEARAVLEQGRQADPGNPAVLRSLGLELFRAGDISGGLALYDRGRWALREFDKYRRPFDAPFWQGQDLTGKSLLVWAEQGIGDQVMQARVLPKLQKLGARITLEADARLPALLRQPGEIACWQQLKAPQPGLAKQRFDYQTSMLSAWRFVPEPLAGALSIQADAGLSRRYRAAWDAMGAAKTIGLSWFSKAKATGQERSLDPALLRPLSAYPGVRLQSLQYGDVDLDAVTAAIGARLLADSGSDPLRDLRGQIAQISALDCVITIDNATAHFAGALGVPCFVLLPVGSEWRWGTVEAPTALYPSVTTFRARARGQWGAPLWELLSHLERTILLRP